MMMFGYGTQSCPGRFFVNNEVKIILANLILNFDLALADGKERPKPMTGGVNFKPDPSEEVLIRRRR
jgi:cytochrome P450